MGNHPTKNVGIVGGGIGGMVAALLLRKKGCEVTIYEKETQLGGRLAFHRHEEWRIDQGPTVVLLPELIFSILKEAGIDSERLKAKMTLCDPLVRVHYKDGTIFNKYKNLDKQVAEIERIFPGETANFMAYMKDLQRIYEQAKPVFLERAFKNKWSLLSWRNLITLWRAKIHMSVQQLAAKYFRDDRLRHAFSLQTLYIGGAPEKTPGLYSLIPYAEQAFGIWYLKGGYATLAEMLVDELRDAGVTVCYQNEITELLFVDKRCTGVVANGQKHYHDFIVYNGDYPNLHTLIGVAERRKSKQHYQPSSGCLLVYMMANRQWDTLSTHQFFLPTDFDEQLRTIFRDHQIPTDPAYYVFQPQTVDEQAAPPGKTLLYVLIPVPSQIEGEWSTVAESLVEKVLHNLQERALPGLLDSLEWRDIRTPADAQAFGLFGGGSFGLAPTLSQSGMFRPQIMDRDIEGLYAVGASIHPGGGIPIVMQGAMLLTQHLLKEMGI
jgi:phytoene desaturase